jgi:glyoxylase-like metal-dependent hydrolase (beta-lactamase superfamily II)
MDDTVIIKRLVVGSLSANCYIVGPETTRTGFLIDPGGDAGDILKAISDTKIHIKIIVLTHGHSDHIAALHEIQNRTGAEVAIHAADAGFLQGRSAFSSMFGISYKTPGPPDRLLHDGDTIDIDDLHLSVLHTPGHTPGSICLLMDNKVFTGDTLFYRGIGTTLMPGSSRRQLIDSIQTRLMALPDSTIVYPGHGRETTIGAERQNNPFLHGAVS